MRMSMRRFTRLTNTFSKRVENLARDIAVHFMHYNFCRVHKTLVTKPAVATGGVDHAWSAYSFFPKSPRMTLTDSLPRLKVRTSKCRLSEGVTCL
jgi:hypothetical protein